jgi:predicted DNA-binding ribbon-helix-helix protein
LSNVRSSSPVTRPASAELVGEIDGNRQQGNLSSAIRLFVLDYFRTRAIPAATVAQDARPQA